MTKVLKVPPFIPTPVAGAEKKTDPMVVLTVRLPPKTRDAIRLLWRSDPDIKSVSHVVQLAVDDFLTRRA